MFDEWKKRRKLIRALRHADKKRAPLRNVTVDSENVDDYYSLYKVDTEIDGILADLEELEEGRLKRTAHRFGIPFREVSFDEWLKVKESGHNPKTVGRLSHRELAELRRNITEARFTYWKKWAELLVPILSLLIAIIALLRK